MKTIAINSDEARALCKASNACHREGYDPVEDPKSPWTKYLTKEHQQEFFAEICRIHDLRWESEDPISVDEYNDLCELNHQRYGFDTAIAFGKSTAADFRKRVGTKLLNS